MSIPAVFGEQPVVFAVAGFTGSGGSGFVLLDVGHGETEMMVVIVFESVFVLCLSRK